MDTDAIHAPDLRTPSQERAVSTDTLARPETTTEAPEARAGSGTYTITSELYRNSRGGSSRGDNGGLSTGTNSGNSRSTSEHGLPRSHIPVTRVGLSPRLWRELYNVVALGVALLNYAFTDDERKTRDKFVAALENEDIRQDILTKPHRMLPEIDVKLARIQVAELAIKNGTWMCIAGLKKEKDILQFHAFWRRRGNKKSAPFKICYHPVRIEQTARATCAMKAMSDRTLCGALIVVETSNLGQRTSTIGGLLKVNGKFFALTTRHLPGNGGQDTEVENHGPEFRPGSLLIPNDEAFETDSQEFWDSFLLHSATGEQEEEAANRSAHPSMSDEYKGRDESGDFEQSLVADAPPGEGYFSFRVDEDEIFVGRDWQLVPIHPDDLLPNEIPEYQDAQEWAQFISLSIDMVCDDLSKLFERSPVTPKKTWVISGMGGLRNCSMLPNSSSMISTDGIVQEVWTIVFDDQDLEPGDSGSWVVDRAYRQLLGMVVARSPSVGYVVPFASVRKDIARTLRLPLESVELPSRHDAAFGRITTRPQPHPGPPDVPLVVLQRYLHYIVPLAVAYMAVLLLHDSGLQYSALSQILVFPVLILGFWAALEVCLHHRPMRLGRQHLPGHFHRLFLELFVVILTAAVLGVSGAYLWRTCSNLFSSFTSNLTSGNLLDNLQRTMQKMSNFHQILVRLRDLTPAGRNIYDLYRKALDRILEVLHEIRRRVEAVIRNPFGLLRLGI